jgi:1-acyl-sn-glycerol-3-phosphate acyltransferase
MLDFKPPKHHAAGYRLVKLAHGWMLGHWRKGLRVVMSEEASHRLREAYQHHCVLLPNHRNHDDPYVMFALSAKTRQPYYYLSARETFTEDAGGKWRGWAMQHLGCYSVVRGAADRASFRMTRDLIASGKRPVVIFPEGEVSHRTDTVMPFQKGIFTLAFWALEEVVASASDGARVLLVPMAIHYHVSEKYAAELHWGLARLEQALLGEPQDGDPLARIRRIGGHLLDVLEGVYRGKPQREMSIGERTTSLRSDILGEMERFFQLHPRNDDGILDRARAVRNRLDEEVYAEIDPGSWYARVMHERRVERLHGFYDAVKRVCAFHAVDLLAVEQHPHLSTFFETLWLLEAEVFGAPKSLVPRTAEVRVGNPIVLNEHHERYLAQKRDTVESVTTLAEDAVLALVKAANATE